MEQEHLNQFDEFEAQPFFRRNLLPLWMKIFCWIFIVLGVFSILSFICGLFGNSAGIEFYGLSTDAPLSFTSLIVTIILTFKGFTAYSLWYEKDNAINLVKFDSAGGIIICIATMIITPVIHKGPLTFRFEILFLLAYYTKTRKIEYAWHNKQY